MKVFICLALASMAAAAPDHQMVFGKGIIMPENPSMDLASEQYISSLEMSRSSIPSSYDAVAKGLVTPVKNQKQCGSCAAFSSTAVIETCMIKAGGMAADLSEQSLIDCGYNGKSMKACNGAWPNAYLEWISENRGGELPHETFNPYRNTNPALHCERFSNYHTGANVEKSIYTHNCDENKLKDLVAEHGAVITTVYASDKAFMHYSGGVFDSCSSTQVNHGVTVVGYGRENGKDFWKVKNSWSESWGEDGYIKIRRGRGTCGIGGTCVTAKCASNGKRDKPITTTARPASATCDISKLYGNPNINGNINLNTGMPDKNYYSEVSCKNSKCTPRDPSIKDACKYICGRDVC